LAEPILVSEPQPASQTNPAAPPVGETAPPPAQGVTAAQPPTSHKPTTIPNARKGYKLTLWVTASDETGLADVNGLVQLDGADPIPFCHLKGVQNPLARALQEAYVAIERVRARPPKMVAPAVTPAAPPTAPRAKAAPAASDAPATLPQARPGASAPPEATGGPLRPLVSPIKHPDAAQKQPALF
jgi:hypothetical protein